MTINLSTLLIVTFAVTGLACAGALRSPEPPVAGLDQARFASNCVAQGGSFSGSATSIACRLGPSIEVRCAVAPTLGNCRWTGPIEAAVLEGIFALGAERS